MKILFAVLGGIGILSSLITIFRQEDWWIRVFDFPRIQIIALLLISLVGFLIFWENAAWEIVYTGLTIAGLVVQLYRMYPYSTIFPNEVHQSKQGHTDNSVKVLVCNVEMKNEKYDKCLEVIREADADLIICLETDERWQRALDQLEDGWPYTLKKPQDNTYGMLLYSRLKLENSQVRFLVEGDVPSFYTTVHLPSGRTIEFYGLHPKPPGPHHNYETLERDAELLIVGNEVNDHNRPVIVAGDMNDVAWSYTTRLFQNYSGLLDPRVGRGMFNTFHARYLFFRWPLDHIFHSTHFKLIDIRRLNYVGSDHFPIMIHLNFEDGAHIYQKEPQPDSEDMGLVHDKMNDLDNKNVNP